MCNFFILFHSKLKHTISLFLYTQVSGRYQKKAIKWQILLNGLQSSITPLSFNFTSEAVIKNFEENNSIVPYFFFFPPKEAKPIIEAVSGSSFEYYSKPYS